MANFAKPLTELGELALSTRVEEGLASIGQKLAADGILANLAERMGARLPAAAESVQSLGIVSSDARVADQFLRRADIVLPSAKGDALSAPGHVTLGDPFVKSEISLPALHADVPEIQAADRWRLPPGVEDPARGPDPHGPHPHDEVHDPFTPANDPAFYYDINNPELFRRPDHPGSGRLRHEHPLPQGGNYREKPGGVMDRWKRDRPSGSVWKR